MEFFRGGGLQSVAAVYDRRRKEKAYCLSTAVVDRRYN
jgi:hypothetical protein